MKAPLLLAAALAIFGAVGLFAQAPSGSPEQGGTPIPIDEELAEAEPGLGSVEGIDKENALSRFGIVTLGSFPIMLLYSDFSFDIGKYIANGFDSAYAPWPFKSEFSEPPSDGEKALRIGVAVGASVGIGIIDWLIRKDKAKKAELRRDALLEYAEGSLVEGEARDAGQDAAPKP